MSSSMVCEGVTPLWNVLEAIGMCRSPCSGGGLQGAPTPVDVCLFLGMGRQGESGEEGVGKKGKGVGLGAR